MSLGKSICVDSQHAGVKAEPPRHWSFPSLAVFLVVASYLCLYGLVPRAYSIGPAVLLLFSVFCIRREDLRNLNHFDLGRVSAALCLYCLVQWLILALHGEDISEFDLAFRYIAAAVVLIVVTKYPVSGASVFVLCAIGAALSGAYAFYQLESLQRIRVDTFDNAIHFGNGSMALAMICLCGLLSGLEKRIPGYLAGVLLLGFVFGMYAVLASGSRGVWIAFPVLVIVLVTLYWRRISIGKKLLGGIAVAGILGGMTMFQFGTIESRVTQGVDQYSAYFGSGQNGTSVGLRLDMWKAGLVAFDENPVIGVGPAGVDRVVSGLIDEQLIHPNTARFRHLHNQFIDILARQGVVGIAFYILLIGSIIYSFLRIFLDVRVSPLGHALSAAGLVFVVQHLIVSLTLSTLERSIGSMMFLFMVVFLLASAAGERKTVLPANR